MTFAEKKMQELMRELKHRLDSGYAIEDIKTAVRLLEREQTPTRIGGRPLGVGNKGSQLIEHIALIRERLHDKEKRGDIANSFQVSRQTLNSFIATHLPEYHRSK